MTITAQAVPATGATAVQTLVWTIAFAQACYEEVIVRSKLVILVECIVINDEHIQGRPPSQRLLLRLQEAVITD